MQEPGRRRRGRRTVSSIAECFYFDFVRLHRDLTSTSCYRSRTAVAPLERLKILMQVQGNEKIYKGVWQVGIWAQLTCRGRACCGPACNDWASAAAVSA
jgi:hypothetical protein